MRGPWSTLPEQRAALHRAAAASGCRVTAESERKTSLGSYLSASLDCPDGWAGARLLSALAEEDAATAGARDEALALRRAHPSDRAFVRAVHDQAKRLRFDREAGEVFAMGSYTWDAGGGDCDDHARAVYALLRAGGAPARIAYLHAPGGDPSHAVAQAYVDGAWQWLESTLDADQGEHPIQAARRLGHLRADLSLQASTLDPRTLERRPMLGALTADQVAHFEARANSADISPAFMRGVAEVARRMRLRGADVTGEDLLSVWNGETGVHASVYGPKKPDGTSANADGLFDYGLNAIHGEAGLRAVGWTGTPEAFLILSPELQLPYVERFYTRMVPASAWPAVKGARSLYAINAWPGYFAAFPLAFQQDDYVIARAGKGAFYTGFALTEPGVNYAKDIDKWIAKQQIAGGARWIELRERYWIESGEIPNSSLSLGGAVKTSFFLGACGALAVYLVQQQG